MGNKILFRMLVDNSRQFIGMPTPAQFLADHLYEMICYCCHRVCPCVRSCVIIVSCGQTIHRWSPMFWIIVSFILDTRWHSQNFANAHVTATL
jgi:hypothetical protein